MSEDENKLIDPASVVPTTDEKLKSPEEIQAIINELDNVPFSPDRAMALRGLPGYTNFPSVAEIIKEYKANKTRGTYLIAEYLTHKFDIITVGEHEREMFIYDNGCYREAVNEIIFPEIQRLLRHEVTKNSKNETFHKIADMTSHNRSIFDSSPLSKINLKDGVYDFETGEFGPHFPDYRFNHQFPILYNQDAKCPKTMAFLEQVLEPEQIPIIQEWLGYYFYRLYSFKKAVIFVGEGDTGKTTLLEVITFLLGKENLSGVSLHKMSSDKFSAAHLYRKHGNLVDELSAKDISDTGAFKVATGGGSIMGEYKFGNQFSFLNFSKLTFACNRVPDVTDFNDEAYFNRWMVIRFTKTIEKKIPNFIATLTTEEERSGLFNWAMDGLRRLLENKQFSYMKDAMATKTEMMRSGSSIAQFAAEGIEQLTDSEISKEDMYEAYVRFCQERELAAETIKMVGMKLAFYVPYITEGFILTTKGKQVRGWRNVSVKQATEVKNPEIPQKVEKEQWEKDFDEVKAPESF